MLLRYTTAGALDTTFDTDGVVETNIATGAADTWVGINHTWDGKLIVSGYANGDFAAGRYFSGAGLDQRLYVQQDANWNVTSVSNSFGATVERYRFTPYGQRTVLNDDFTVDGDNTSDYAFNVGHQGLTHDGETGLIYNRARYLHNTLGRFTAVDPLGTAYQNGMNLYEYVLGNPVRHSDSTGSRAEKPEQSSDEFSEIVKLIWGDTPPPLYEGPYPSVSYPNAPNLRPSNPNNRGSLDLSDEFEMGLKKSCQQIFKKALVVLIALPGEVAGAIGIILFEPSQIGNSDTITGPYAPRPEPTTSPSTQPTK